MTVHIKRLAVGIENPEHLVRVQGARLAASREKGEERLYTYTRMTPKRVSDLLDGGSLYWVIKGQMKVRQRILGVETDVDEEGRSFCRLRIDPELVPLRARQHKPFQGWRYMEPGDAPPDDAAPAEGQGDLPSEMAEELRDLGLL